MLAEDSLLRYPRDSSFLMPKISTKFDRGHPLEGAECRWGGLKSATFEKCPAIISKTVKDRHIVSIKVE